MPKRDKKIKLKLKRENPPQRRELSFAGLFLSCDNDESTKKK
jgi:hypothetical protein